MPERMARGIGRLTMQKPRAKRTARLLWLIGLALGVLAGLAVAIPLAHSSATADALGAAAPAGD